MPKGWIRFTATANLCSQVFVDAPSSIRPLAQSPGLDRDLDIRMTDNFEYRQWGVPGSKLGRDVPKLTGLM